MIETMTLVKEDVVKITALDIKQKQFPVKFRGFDINDVYAFMELMREEMEELFRENASLKERKHSLENQINETRDMESALRETFVNFQQMVGTYNDNARKESEILTRDSESKAVVMIKKAQEIVARIHEDILKLKKIRTHSRNELIRLIEAHQRMIKSTEDSLPGEIRVKEKSQKKIQDYQDRSRSSEREHPSNSDDISLLFNSLKKKKS